MDNIRAQSDSDAETPGQICASEDSQAVLAPGACVALSNPSGIGEIRYTLDGSNPSALGAGILYEGRIEIGKDTTVKACAKTEGGVCGPVSEFIYTVDETMQERLIQGMDQAGDWRVDNSASASFTVEERTEGMLEGTGALTVTAAYSGNAGEFATLIWNPSPGLDLSDAVQLKFDVYTESALEGKNLNLNMSNGSDLVHMGGVAQGQEGAWKTVTVDISQMARNNLSEMKFWLYGGDAPADLPAQFTVVIDNMRVVEPIEKETPPAELTEEVLLNGMEDASQWKQENCENVTLDGSPEADMYTEGNGSLKVTGTYRGKSGDFANLVWNPEGGLDLTGAKRLLIDVYPLKLLDNATLNLNISNSGSVIYMGSPFAGASEGAWSTVSVDLTGKTADHINELKFWLYANDMPQDQECSMSFLIDNIRVEKAKTAPEVISSERSGSVLMPGTQIRLTASEGVQNAVIFYTVDGTDPRSSAAARQYDSPIPLYCKTEIKAFVRGEGLADGKVCSFRYTLGTGDSSESYLGTENFGQGRYLPLAAAQNVTVDGNLDEWDGYMGITLAKDKYFPMDPADFAMTARAAYDEDNLYLGIDVTDDVANGAYGYGMYGGDCIQIAFSEAGDAYGPEYGFSNVDQQAEIWRWYPGSASWDKDSIEYKTVRADGHTFYEMAIPWKAIFQEKPAENFRMTILAGDNDGASGGASLEWRSGISNGKTAVDFAYVQMLDPDSDWGLQVVPGTVSADAGTMECYLWNRSGAEKTCTLKYNGVERTVTVPGGMTFKKLISCRTENETLSLQIQAEDEKGEIKQAGWSSNSQSSELTEEEQQERRENLENRIKSCETLETDAVCFKVDSVSGSYQLLDKSTGVLWSSGIGSDGAGKIEISQPGLRPVTVLLNEPKQVQKTDNAIEAVYRPQVSGADTGITLKVCYELLGTGDGIRVSYEPEQTGSYEISGVCLLDQAMWTLDTEDGYAAVPEGVGKLYPADGRETFTRRYETYGDYNMAFVGVVKEGSALLIDWDDPYTALSVRHAKVDSPLAAGGDMVSVSLDMKESSRTFAIRAVGAGGYVEIARAYRTVAAQKGWLKTLAEKRAENPQLELLYGAATVKPDTLIRGSGSVYNSHTFAEVGEIAQHWKEVLGIDKALFTLGGWIHKGFDNQYPDILPAAPEAGGNDGLAALSEQIKGYGYLFGLHDNYQDMYADAPSFDEKYLMFGADGRPLSGGVWAGGTPYLMAADQAMVFAERNLPQVKELFAPTSYFIDTTFNVPLNISYAPNAVTRSEDMYWKQKLAEYAGDTFGVFGSEGGVEWAVPYGDYFEGVLTSKTKSSPADHVIPLMELVYGDCVNLYTHMSDKIGFAGNNPAKTALSCILYSENPLYQLTDGVYFKEDTQMPVTPSVSKLHSLGNGEFEITYRWDAQEDVPVDYKTVFTHYTGIPAAFSEASIAFQEGHDMKVSTGSWKKGDVVEDGPYRVSVPKGKTGKYAIMVMLLSDRGSRMHLNGNGDSYSRYLLGYINIAADGSVDFEDAPQLITTDYEVYSRNDGGYGEAEGLGYYDSLIKNTHEVLTYLNQLTAEKPMTGHRYLTADETVEMTEFEDIRITANFGSAPYQLEAGTVLPEYGFVVQAPSFEAYYALEYKGTAYENGALFTIRSLDGGSVSDADQVAVYHGFGDGRVNWDGSEYAVASEAVLTREKKTEDTGNKNEEKTEEKTDDKPAGIPDNGTGREPGETAGQQDGGEQTVSASTGDSDADMTAVAAVLVISGCCILAAAVRMYRKKRNCIE